MLLREEVREGEAEEEGEEGQFSFFLLISSISCSASSAHTLLYRF